MSSSPSDPMHQTLLSSCCLWLVTTTTYAHTFERGRFPYDAQEWENLEMRGWGRCLRKTKLHFVRKDKFIDIDFGEHKRLSWDSGRLLLLADLWWKVVRKTKVLRKQSGKLLQLQWEVVSSIFAQSGKLMQYLWFGFAFEEVLSWFKQWTSHTLGSFQNSDPGCRPQSVRGGHHWFLWLTVSTYKPIKAI